VTLFGDSAGAMATCAHLTSPSAAGLFHRAVIQSGTCMTDWPDNSFAPGVPAGSAWIARSKLEAAGSSLAASLGCADPATAAACLRRLPVSALLSVESTEGLGPAFGTRILPLNPAQALREARFHRAPVLSGTTRDEHRLYVAFLWDHPISPERYRQLLNDAFAKHAEQVAARYPLSAYDSPALAWAAVTTDRIWACPTLSANRLFVRRTSVYGYEFADRNAPVVFSASSPIPPGAYHGSQLPYLFDLGGTKVTFTANQQKLSDQMIRYWGRFAATGNPNGPGLARWGRFGHAGSEKPKVQSLAPTGAGGIRPIDFASEHHCDFWSSLR
jgi:para-nitrobenzyl esterase